MCLTIPGRVIRIHDDASGQRWAEVDYGHQQRKAHLLYLPETQVGDYVVVQAGFAITRLEEREALESLRYIAEMNAGASESRSRPPSVGT